MVAESSFYKDSTTYDQIQSAVTVLADAQTAASSAAASAAAAEAAVESIGVGVTGTGNRVLATSPSLTTPVISGFTSFLPVANPNNYIAIQNGTAPLGGGATLNFRFQNGPFSAPVTSKFGDEMFYFSGESWDGTTFVQTIPNAIVCIALEDFTPTAHGSAWVIQSTSMGTTDGQCEMCWCDGATAVAGNYSVPGMGQGTINAENGVYDSYHRVYFPTGTDVAVADGGTGASTASAARTNLGVGTADSPQFAGVNIGHASDTTLTRTGAGDIAVEGNTVYRAGGTDVAVADGGTGASTAAQARINLGLSAGQYPGTATNDNASSGNVGEFISSVIPFGTALGLTTTVAANLTSLPLTAGDWDVTFTPIFVPGATTAITQMAASISTTSATFDNNPPNFCSQSYSPTIGTGGNVFSAPTITRRISLASTTTVYGVGRSTFSTSTMGIYGALEARRVR